MKVLASFISYGSRMDNLDRIVLRDGMGFVLDGYQCTEGDMDALAASAKIDKDNGFCVSDCRGRFCYAGVSVSEDTVFFYYSGDCRIYVQEQGLLTSDQTVAWSKISRNHEDKRKVADYVKRHPSRNVLTGRYDGSPGRPFMEQRRLMSNIMICSDGFWSAFDESELLSFVVAPENVKERSEQVVFSDNAACLVVGL